MWILILAFVLAFCSFGYEIMLAFVASQMTGLSVLSKSLTFGSFIFGLGVGGWRASGALEKHTPARAAPDFIKLLFSVEWPLVVLVCVGALGVLLYHACLLAANWPAANMWALVGVQPVALGVGYLSGFELPILVAWGARSKWQENHLLVPHYAGVLVASIVVLSVLVPRFDMLVSVFILVALNLIVSWALAFYMLKKTQAMRFKLWAFVAGGLSACVWAGALYITPAFYKTYTQQLHHNVRGVQNLKRVWTTLQALPEVERTRSPYQYIDVVQSQNLQPRQQQHVKKIFADVNFNVPVVYSLYLNRQSQFSSVLEHTYHQQITHVPIEYFNFTPQRALVLGAGDGLLARELLKYPNIKIDLVELDAQVLKLAKEDARFLWQNKGSLFNPRVQVYAEDAISFLRKKMKAHKRLQSQLAAKAQGAWAARPEDADQPGQAASKLLYDAVFIDFPFPDNYDISKLYSVEFYKLVARVLNPRGFMVLDAPLDLGEEAGALSDRNATASTITSGVAVPIKQQNSILLSTLYYAGFEHQVPYGVRGGFVAARLEAPRPVQPKVLVGPHTSKFLKQNLRFRADIVQQTLRGKKFINSMFKPQPIRRRL